MKYENAKRGVAMIFTAEILELIATILTGSFLSVKDSTPAIGFAAALVALVLVVAAAVKEIKGLILAGKDEKIYKYALILVVVWFAASVLSAILPVLFPSMKASTLEFSSDLINLLVMVNVIQATNTLFRSKGDEGMVKKGNVALCINIVAFCIANALESYMKVTGLSDEKKAVVFIAVGLVYAATVLVGYIKYLSYLKKAAAEL